MVNWKKFFLENDEKDNKENVNPPSLEEGAKEIEDSDEEFEISGQVEEDTKKENLDTSKKEISKADEAEGFIAKFVNLFLTPEKDKTKKKTEDVAEDKQEDYKTYFERQKKKQANNEEIEEINKSIEEDTAKENEIQEEKLEDKEKQEDSGINYAELGLENSYDDYEDYLFDEFEEDDNSEKEKQSIFSRLKAKLSAFTQYGLKKDDNKEDIEASNTKEKTHKKESAFSKLMTKITTSKKDEEELDEDDFSLFEELDKIEEKDILEEKISNEAIQEKLKSLGIEAKNVKDVDLFSQREVRRDHPTLASVKVRRIMQEHEIDNLEKDVKLEENKGRFTKETFEQNQDIEIEENEQEQVEHKSKNLEEITKLNNDFNQVNRKEEKKSSSKNNLKSETNNIDSAINEIKKQEQLALSDNKDYTIVVEESDSEKERREKLKHTTVDDVLDGREDLFETDIERVAKKIVDTRIDEEVSEEVEKFRKDVYKEKTSEDLVANKDNKTALDELILETKLVENKKEKEENEEIRNLEKNLEMIREENEFKAQLDAEFEEEISIEQIARESEYKFENYEDLKQEKEEEDRLSGYSDYNLDPEEIEALTIQNKIESETENTNIETLNKEVNNERIRRKISVNIERFIKESLPSKENSLISEESKKDIRKESKKQLIDIKKISSDKENTRKNRKKLYSEDMDDYIDGRNAIITGEYRTRDRGYRPVSKEQIENNIRKLDSIFEKYSHVKIPNVNSKQSTDFAKLKSDATSGKYKPTQFVSAVYGTNIPQNTSYNLERKRRRREASNYFKEIASQDEAVWNIDVNTRATKAKPKAKRTRRTKAKEE